MALVGVDGRKERWGRRKNMGAKGTRCAGRKIRRNRKGRRLTPGEKDALGINRQCVNNGIMPAEIEYERALGALPLFDVVAPRGAGGERVLGWVDRERADGLFVVRQRYARFAGC
jgi:hypothetical protein